MNSIPLTFRISVTLIVMIGLLSFLVKVTLAHSSTVYDEVKTIIYQENKEVIFNPERGFHFLSNYSRGSSPLSRSELEMQKLQMRSLVNRNYTLSQFINGDISQSWLDIMQRDFDTIRAAGIKAVIRFRYGGRDEPDAPLHIIVRHLEQLQPLLERNVDVIAWMEAGFIGAWGEWHSSTNNLNTTENMRAVLFAILNVLPERRMVNIRRPHFKMSIFSSYEPVKEEEAFDGSFKSRTGHHNDGFLASSTDLGTYSNVQFEKNYLSQDTRFVPMGGETGGGDNQEAIDIYRKCDYAIEEMERLNWSYMNQGWYHPVSEGWEEEGCLDEIKNRLGYRFVMNEGHYSTEVRQGNVFSFSLNLRNDGFSSLYNPRDIKVILRNRQEPYESFEVYLPEDPRFWQAGEEIEVEYELGISEYIPDGSYDLLFMMPDPEPELHERPEYAIQMANKDVWESDTGLNNLSHVVTVNSQANGVAYQDSLWFHKKKTPTASTNTTPDLPDEVRLHANYPNPFNPSTAIHFDIPSKRAVRLEVYDLTGRKVQTLLNDVKSTGTHTVYFEPVGLSSGIYVYRLIAGNYTQSKKMLYVK